MVRKTIVCVIGVSMIAGCAPRVGLYRAEKLMSKGKWAEAESLLHGIAQSHARSPWCQKALMLRGCVEFKQNRLEDAERTLEAAREAVPGGEWADDAEYYLARVRYRKGDILEAREGFRRVMTAFGDDAKRSNCKVLALEELEFIEKRGLVPSHG
ncbi:tetratricopeptide repeat protein [Candidatus Fermentibacteria bacterium]|nr:tetratricopeptide repeat protein [Candidatus Fermentibacteria bacterium]